MNLQREQSTFKGVFNISGSAELHAFKLAAGHVKDLQYLFGLGKYYPVIWMHEHSSHVISSFKGMFWLRTLASYNLLGTLSRRMNIRPW